MEFRPLMLLSDTEIKKRQLIQGAADKQFRHASYDVRIGEIIDHTGSILAESASFVLPPNGIVEVVSEERVCVANDVCGFASIKTSLCDQGILALNIGIIDPGWQGKISTTLINFGSEKFIFQTGDTFLRISFQAIANHSVPPPRVIPDGEYIRSKQKKAAKYFNEKFIDVTDAAQQAFGNYKSWLILWLPTMGLAVTLVLAIATYYATYLASRDSISLTKDYWLPSADQIKRQINDSVEVRLNAEPRLTQVLDDLGKARSELQSQKVKIVELTEAVELLRAEVTRLRRDDSQ